MNTLLITNEFPNPCEPTKGLFNWHLARGLARRSRVEVISPVAWTDEWRASRDVRKRLANDRHSVTEDGIPVHYPRYWFVPKAMRRFYGAFYAASVRSSVKRVLECNRPDFVLSYWAHPDGLIGARVARRAGAASAVIVGGSDVLLLPRDKTRRRCVLKSLEANDAILTVNIHLKSAVEAMGIAAEKVHVWHQGVDTELFHPATDKQQVRRSLGIETDAPTLVWVGRMVHVKGLDVLVAACSALRERNQEFRVHLVGDGPLRASLEAEVASRKLGAHVKFVGSKQHKELGDWYRAADLTLLPSRSEGLPNVLRESLACGTPFVASRVGGIDEIAEGGAGMLVPPERPEQLADAIVRALRERPSDAVLKGKSPSWPESAARLLEIARPLLRDTRAQCHPERSEGSGVVAQGGQILRCAQDDKTLDTALHGS